MPTYVPPTPGFITTLRHTLPMALRALVMPLRALVMPLRALAMPLCVLAMTLGLTGCNDAPPSTTPKQPSPVAATRPLQQNVPLLVESTGTLQAVNSAAIAARVEGTLQKVAYADGALVQAGDTLFVIDPSVYRAKLQQAEATLTAQKAVRQRASIEYARNRKLYAEKAASQTTLESWREQLGNAEAQVAAAQAAVTQAGIELGYTVIKAPFTGRVSRHAVDIGNVVSPQTGTLATIVSQDPVYAAFTASAASVLPLLHSVDDAKTIPLDLAVGEGAYTAKGTLEYIAPEVDASSGTLALRGIFPNGDGKLLPGLFVRIRMSTGQVNKVLVIPRQCLLRTQGKTFVYVIGNNNAAEMVPVQTGPDIDNAQVAILHGITPETWVIYEGMAHVRPGQPVVNTAK